MSASVESSASLALANEVPDAEVLHSGLVTPYRDVEALYASADGTTASPDEFSPSMSVGDEHLETPDKDLTGVNLFSTPDVRNTAKKLFISPIGVEEMYTLSGIGVVRSGLPVTNFSKRGLFRRESGEIEAIDEKSEVDEPVMEAGTGQAQTIRRTGAFVPKQKQPSDEVLDTEYSPMKEDAINP